MTDRGKAFAVAAVLFLAFNSNCRAIGTRDTLVVELTALSLGSTYDVDLSEFEETRFFSLASGEYMGRGARVLPAYPVVPALMAAPIFGVFSAFGVFDPARPSEAVRSAVGKLASSLFLAAACGLLYLLVRRHVPDAPAAFVVIAAALASPFWSTASQALWGHSTAALLLALGLILARPTNESPAAAVVAGAAVALAVATRALLMPFAMGLLVLSARSRSFFWLAGGMGVAIGLLEAWYLTTYGSLLGGAALLESDSIHQQVHMVGSAWTANLVANAAGILLSPNRGLLVYMPIALFAIAGAWPLWRSGPEARWTLIVPTALYLVGWSAYSVWWGGHSYGPRYASDIVMPLTIMAAAFFWTGAKRSLRTIGAVALVWSIGIQAIGVYFYPNGNWNALPDDVDRVHTRLWDWRDTQIVRTLNGGFYTNHLSRLRGTSDAP